jgi:hypothetical protein
VSVLDSKTTLIVTADHGHVNIGGHGGNGDDVMDIPFIIYKKESNLSSRYQNIDNSKLQAIDRLRIVEFSV